MLREIAADDARRANDEGSFVHVSKCRKLQCWQEESADARLAKEAD
jgi:hypothetical protein